MLNLTLHLGSAFGQTNPGFFGKKIAIGYDFQYCPIGYADAIENAPEIRAISNANFYIEYAFSKYRCIAFNIGFQKIPVSYQKSFQKPIQQEFTINGDQEKIYIAKVGGYSDISSTNFGIKYCLYDPAKTISAPVGFSHYFKADVYLNQVLNNNYEYQYDESLGYNYNLNNYQINYVNTHIIKGFENKNTVNYSLGYGVESKLALTRFLFLKINGEFNFAPKLLQEWSDSESSYDPISINEDMTETSLGANEFRNMFIFGIGIGVLL